MVRAILAIIIGAISALLISMTAPKLYEMFQIKGWIPGAVPIPAVVTSKWHQAAEENPNGREVYWVAWSGGDIKVRGKHRTSMFEEQWSAVEIGDKQRVVYIPWSDDTYLQDGIYVSFGNFIFDFILLTLELLGITYFCRAAKGIIENLRAKVRLRQGNA